MFAQRVAQRRCHQLRGAGAGEQMIEAGQQVVGRSLLGPQAGTDTAAQWQQFVAPQFVGQARVAASTTEASRRLSEMFPKREVIGRLA